MSGITVLIFKSNKNKQKYAGVRQKRIKKFILGIAGSKDF